MRSATGPTVTAGVIAAAVTVIGFTVVHDLLIVDIWDTITRMVLAGVLCGAAIVWSYRAGTESHSPRRWYAYIATLTGLLIPLGAASFVVLDPRFTMAEMTMASDPLAELIPPATPLMVSAVVVGTVVTWVAFGNRRGRAVVPMVLTQVLLVYLIGHNLAILGLVESSSEVTTVLLEMIVLTIVLGGAFAALTTVASSAIARARRVLSPEPERQRT